jgi:hypothetical protein
MQLYVVKMPAVVEPPEKHFLLSFRQFLLSVPTADSHCPAFCPKVMDFPE